MSLVEPYARWDPYHIYFLNLIDLPMSVYPSGEAYFEGLYMYINLGRVTDNCRYGSTCIKAKL